jgi:uncharacterized membrane protein YeaQ/YmgE (transglycosylase-associated protein family)
MDEFEMTLALQFTPQTVFSMLGALVGSLISADVKRYGWRLTILFTIVASVVGGAMSEYLVNEKNIWALFALNVPTGMVVGTTLDVIRISSPRMIEKLVNTVGDNTVNIVSNAVKNKLESVTGGISTDTPTQYNNLSVDNTENSDIINKG